MSERERSPLALRMLKWFCPEHLLEEIEGDLLQRFLIEEKKLGSATARRKLWWRTIRFFRPGIVLRNKFSTELNHGYMLKSYFTIAYRQLLKSRVFTIINVLGLAVGITAFLLIVQYASFELSYDRFHENSGAIYRVGLERRVNGVLQHASSKTFVGIRAVLKENFPEVEHYTGFYRTPANTGFLFRLNGKVYNETGGVLNPDSSFFRVFPTLLVRGNPEKVLNDKKNLVISESMARKLFGDADPVGQTIQRIDDYDEGVDFVVSGVMKDIPENAHVHAVFLRHILDSWPDAENWQGMIHTYITLKPGSDPQRISERVNAILRTLEKDNPMVKGTTVFLQPITDIHLSSHFSDELEPNGSKATLYSLAVIGVIILVMAWINYVNLETARFIRRMKEVGVRRIIGSAKSDLAVQFLVEYCCLTILAGILAVLLLYLAIPYFSEVTGIPITKIQWGNPLVWIVSAAIFVCGSIVAGTYPAWFLIRLNPLATLKGNSGRSRGGLVRRSLVVIQFTASLVLIAFVLVIREQLEFMRVSNKKFEVDHVIALSNPMAYSGEDLQEKYNGYKRFENTMLQNPAVKMVTSSSAVPGTEIGFSYVNLIKRHKDDPYDPTGYKTLFVDYNYIPTFGLKVLAGTNFPERESGKPWIEPWNEKGWTTIVLNEKAIRHLGFKSPEEAIGEEVDFELFDASLKYTIIGVVEDYHHEAVKKEVFPTIFALNYSTFQQVYYSVRLNAGTDPHEALDYIKKTWATVFPERPFDYFFLDEYYDQQFKSELHFAGIFAFFAGTAIFIACLGILGMTLYEANARVKEISIRKVLGATATNLVALLSKDHMKVIIVSVLIGCPLIWYVASEWLSTYPMQIALSGLTFLLPIVVIFTMVVAMTCIQTFRAAHTNPVNHLKNE